jgi:uncharacterized protein
MRFDQLTITLLIRRPDAPELDEATGNALQDAHLAHLAGLHQAGSLLAAGPLLGAPDRRFRGLSILSVDPERARLLEEQDPAVRAGVYSIEAFPWMVPGGAMTFSRTHFPRSIAEARED